MVTDPSHATDSDILMATVYMRSPTGASLLTHKPSAAAIKEFLPSPETVLQVKQALVQRGFTLEAEGVTLSISGPRSLFTEHCTVKDISGRDILEMKELSTYIEGIEFSIPGVPFNGFKK